MHYRSVSVVLTVWLMLIFAGFAGAEPGAAAEAPAKAEAPRQVAQDPALRITTAEVMALFAKEFGDAPLIQETLDKNQSFLLVDARPKVKYEEGHVPGALSIPVPMLEQNLDQIPRDRLVIFYCGGLACPLSSEAAEIAKKHDFTNVKVWYEGEPQWVKSGNYLIAATPWLKKMVDNADKETFLLVDSRPSQVHQKSFIPGSLSLPKVLFEQKQGLLPADKGTPIVFYCGGHPCALSHESARMAMQLGYTKVKVYAAGAPEWGKQNYAMWGNEASGIVAAPKASAPGTLPEEISPEDFKQAVAAGNVAIIDVRSEREFADGHIPGAICIPDGEFYQNLAVTVGKLPVDKPVLLYCSTGARASGAYYAIIDDPKAYHNPFGLQYLGKGVLAKTDGTFTIE